MTDSGPLLTTLAASGATIVAIVGGFLVTRYVSLDTEQQAARRRLSEATHALTNASDEARAREDDYYRHDAGWHLEDPEVYDLLRERYLESEGHDPVTLEEIKVQVGLGAAYTTDAGRARYQERLDLLANETAAAMRATEEIDFGQFGPSNYPTWDEARRHFPQHNVSPVWEGVWAWRSQVDWESLPSLERGLLGPLNQPKPQAVSQSYDQRAFRQAAMAQATNALSVTHAEESMARRALNDTASPRGLVLGLLVLAILTITTVIVPVLYLVPSPAHLTYSSALAITGTFFVGIFVLLTYLAGWAWTLIRGRNSPTGPSIRQGPQLSGPEGAGEDPSLRCWPH
ncbi:hypothetical protein [Nostocoides australiense]